ncbi:MAG: hypothetical protein NAOJABEB_00134 [Steroidobacteraceae bacterium]|nr:hypothetical protein [Steroidobacteraceae bacterium]
MPVPLHPTPESPASERNKRPILEVIAPVFAQTRLVLEIGSGTGQHAVFFARALSHLRWQPSDRADWLPILRERCAREGPANLAVPIELDVSLSRWPAEGADGVFTANTLHIMAWPEVQALFAGVGRVLRRPGSLAVYGPFRYAGAFTTPSNAAFDESLRARDPASGIRDFEAVDALARAEGLALVADYAMPANNQLLVWRGS